LYSEILAAAIAKAFGKYLCSHLFKTVSCIHFQPRLYLSFLGPTLDGCDFDIVYNVAVASLKLYA
jgi:hypothetical protein